MKWNFVSPDHSTDFSWPIYLANIIICEVKLYELLKLKKDMVHTIKWNFFSLDLSTDLENNSVSIFINLCTKESGS